MAALARERAARSIDRATIARLDARVAPKTTEGASRTLWAGFRVLPGTERPIDESLRVALADWLRADDGFNDTIVRRCARAHMVGLLLFANDGTGKDQRTDIAVDFACNAILVVSQESDGKERTLTAGFFDASRGRLLALIHKALPDDKELARLR